MVTTLEEEMSVLDDKIGKYFDQVPPSTFYLPMTECLRVSEASMVNNRESN